MGSLGATRSGYLYKQSHNDAYLEVESASGMWLNLANGQRILDATCGAAVTSIGHGDVRVKRAIVAQLDQVSYCHPGFFRTSIAEQLANFLVDSTNGKMARACITGSGWLSQSLLLSSRLIVPVRFGGDGSRHEARTTILLGAIATVSPVTVHRKRGLLAWFDSGDTGHR
jgi:Aminotransferase class-III